MRQKKILIGQRGGSGEGKSRYGEGSIMGRTRRGRGESAPREWLWKTNPARKKDDCFTTRTAWALMGLHSDRLSCIA